MRKIVSFFFIFFLISFLNSQVASVKIKISQKNIYLFGDLISLDIEISSIMKFSEVRISLKGEIKPDFFNYFFNPPLLKNNRYKTNGKLNFIFFKKGEFLTPSIKLELLDKVNKEEIIVFKKTFKGIKVKEITTLKGEKQILGPFPPVEEEPNFLKIMIFLILFFSVIFFLYNIYALYKKNEIFKRKENVENLELFFNETMKAEKMISLSKIKESSFLLSNILLKLLKLKFSQDVENLTVSEIKEKILKEKIFKSEISERIMKELENLNFIKYSNLKNEENLTKSLKFIRFLINEIRDDKF